MSYLEIAIDRIQTSIVRLTSQQYPRASRAIVSEDKMRSLLKVSEKLRGCFTHVTDDPELMISLYFPQGFSDFLDKSPLQAWSTVIGMTSVFCYYHYYYDEYGRPPLESNIQMIGSIEKYILLYDMSDGGRTLGGNDRLISNCFKAAEDPQSAPIEDIVGQQLGKKFAIEDIKDIRDVYRLIYLSDNFSQVKTILEAADPHDIFKQEFDKSIEYIRKHFKTDI